MNHLFYRKATLLACLVLLINFIRAQPVLYYEQYTSEKGLSENVLYCLHKDKKGFIWAGTDYGLNRFDGYGFKKYFNIPGDTNSISSYSILNIQEDEKGKFWIGTYGGLNYFDPETGRAERIKMPGRGIDYNPESCRILPDGKILFIITEGDSYVYDPIRRILTALKKPGNCHLLSNDIIELPGGQLALFCRNEAGGASVLVLNVAKQQWDAKLPEQVFPFSTPLLPSGYFYDPAGYHLLFSFAAQDVQVFNQYGKNMASLPQSIKDKYPGILFYQAAKIDSGAIWIATSKGLLIYDRQSRSFGMAELKGDSKSLPGNKEIRCLLNDRRGSIWLGIFGEGMLRVENRNLAFRNISLPDIAGSKFTRMIFGLYRWSDDIIAAETSFRNLVLIQNGRVVGRVQESELQLEDIVKVTTGKNLAELTHKQQQVLSGLFEKQQLYPFRFAIHNDSSILLLHLSVLIAGPSGIHPVGKILVPGNLLSDEHYYWVPARDGLYRINKTDLRDTVFTFRKGDANTPSAPGLYHIAMDNEKNLWIGTKGGGLNFFDRKQNKFYHYTMRDGLPDNVVYVVLPDNKGKFWLTTNNGISRLDPATRTFTNFSRRDGLLNAEFNRQGGVLSVDGTIYLSGTSGIDYFMPDEIERTETPPQAIIAELRVNNKEALQQSKSRFPWTDNNISISYTANDFIRPDLIFYRYRLRKDQDWTGVQGINSVVFNSLQPGQYQFEVQASYDNHNWGKTAAYLFYIKTPWWKSGWFYTGLLLLIGGTFYSFYQYRINQLKKIHRLRTDLSQDLHDEVGSALSSIHIYSSVASKAMQVNPQKADEALQHINENTRRVMENMNDIVWAINTSQVGEASFEKKLKNYGYELLTPLNITCHYQIDPEADKRLQHIEARKNILLIAKEAMNNLAKYSGATEATVKLEINHKQLELLIADNGKGFDSQSGRRGNGVWNMRIRTEALGGVFFCDTAPGRGTIITCRIPIANISD